MKAIVIHEYGPPDVLRYQDVPDPQPRAGEIRIRVHAATVNRVLDVSVRAGREGARGPVLPLILGVDCAGKIVRTGPGVDSARVGDDVMCITSGFGKYIVAHSVCLMPKPSTFTFEQAAGLPCVFGTAQLAVRACRGPIGNVGGSGRPVSPVV